MDWGLGCFFFRKGAKKSLHLAWSQRRESGVGSLYTKEVDLYILGT